jgi:hypothetical protein
MKKNAAEAVETKPAEPVSLESVHAELATIRELVRDMALLVLPPNLREPCECGRLASRSLTCVKPGQVGVKTHHLCDECKNPEGWTVVGTTVADGNLQQTLRIANGILART